MSRAHTRRLYFWTRWQRWKPFTTKLWDTI
jgi:hypothetical protein